MPWLVGRGVGGIQITKEAFQCVDLNFNLAAAGKDKADTILFGVVNRQKVHKSIGVGFIETLLFDRFDVINVKACMDTLVGMVVIIVGIVIMITFPAKSVSNQVKLSICLVIAKTCNGNKRILETGRKDI